MLPGTGRIDVRVRDNAGALLSGVAVDLQGPAAAQAVTAAGGDVTFPKLVPGTYAVSARLSGFLDYRNNDVRVDAGSVVIVDVTLQTPAPPPPPSPPPSLLYVLLAAVAVLAGIFALWTYKLRLRLIGQDSGPSLLVPQSSAQAGAEKGLKDYGLRDRDDWKPFLAPDGSPAPAREPLLVQQLGAGEFSEGFYYLVPFGRDDASVGAVACVDGVTGEYQEASPFAMQGEKSWGRMVADWRTPAQTRSRIAERRIDLRLREPVDLKDIGVHSSLVWKPCVQSRSPFLPFRLVKVRGTVRYIRIDGEVFEKLTDTIE